MKGSEFAHLAETDGVWMQEIPLHAVSKVNLGEGWLEHPSRSRFIIDTVRC